MVYSCLRSNLLNIYKMWHCSLVFSTVQDRLRQDLPASSPLPRMRCSCILYVWVTWRVVSLKSSIDKTIKIGWLTWSIRGGTVASNLTLKHSISSQSKFRLIFFPSVIVVFIFSESFRTQMRLSTYISCIVQGWEEPTEFENKPFLLFLASASHDSVCVMG